MAMRCFGRGLGFTAETRPLDLMALRAADSAALLWPVHFFLTAVFAAALDDTFLAMTCLPVATVGRTLGGEVSHCAVQRQSALAAQCSLNTPSTARSSAGLI